MAATAPPRPAKKPTTRKNARTPGAGSNGRAKALLDAATAPPSEAAGALPLGSIEPDHFVNPRGPVEKKSPAFLELVASVKDLGLLEPIVVGPALGDGGKHPIIAGWRRYAAATAAKLKAVPVHEVAITDAKDALVAALAENVARDDMTPLAEARAIDLLMREHGYTQVAAGKAVGMSERTVRERLRLLKIHTEAPVVGDAIDQGTVPMDAAVLMQTIAAVAPKLAGELAAGAVDPKLPWSSSDLAKPDLVAGLLDQVAAGQLKSDGIEALWQWHDHLSSYNKEYLPQLSDEQGKRWAKITPESEWGSTPPAFEFTSKDLVAARDAGVAIEFEYSDRYDRKSHGRWIVAGEFFEQLLETKLQRMEQGGLDRAAARKKAKEAQAGAVDTPETAAAAKEQARKDREKDARDRERAHHRNAVLGERAATAFAPIAMSLEAAKLLALLALEHNPGPLLNRGVRYCDTACLTEVERKNGTIKRSYKLGDKAISELRAQITNATTPAEAIEPVLRAYALARTASEDVVAQSSRAYWSLPFGWNDQVGAKALDALVELSQIDKDLAAEAKKRGAARKPAAAPGKAKTLEDQVVELVSECPGITIPELAQRLDRKQNMLYRVCPGLEKGGRIFKQGRGWHPVAS